MVVHLNGYVFGYQTGRQRILDEMVAGYFAISTRNCESMYIYVWKLSHTCQVFQNALGNLAEKFRTFGG
jgi:hypothetical protein